MEHRNDFEHQVGQGMKRWAEAGEPTLDLEAHVRQRKGTVRPVRRRPWVRWAVSAAAALLLLLGATFTFPAWAGTAAAWPLIGPVIQEIIMKDAGLKWAYDAGLIQGTLAEATHGGVTVRILGVAPDRALTTILYQITGLPEPPAVNEKPIQAPRGLLDSLARPELHNWLTFRVTKVPGGSPGFTAQEQPMRTPLGLFGTITTVPVSAEGGTMELTVEIDGVQVPLSFPVSSSVADRLTREYPVGQTRTVDEITYTIDAVIQTPVQTVVRYTVAKPEYGYGYSWSDHEFSMRLESAGKTVYDSGNYGLGGSRYSLFPRTELPARLIMPADVKGVAADLVWPLAKGAVQTVNDVPVTLTDWEASGTRMAIQFEYPYQRRLVAFGGMELVDGAGQTHPVKVISSGSSAGSPEVPRWISFELELPAGVRPVGVRAKQVAVPVTGPWEFELPAR